MAEFSIVGSVDPFLHVSLKKGKSIYAEREAMVSMDTTLELMGEARGGVLGAWRGGSSSASRSSSKA